MVGSHQNDHPHGYEGHHHHKVPEQNKFSWALTYFFLAVLAVLGIFAGKDHFETKTRDFTVNPEINQLTEEEFSKQAEAYTIKEINKLMSSS